MADIEQIEEITDPLERALEIGRRLNQIPEFQAKLSDMRRAAVLEMKAQGMSYKEIGEALGMHRNRAQQIAEGRTAGGRAGLRSSAAPPPDPE